MLIRSNEVLHVEVIVQLELILCGSSGIICVMSMVIQVAIGKISISNCFFLCAAKLFADHLSNCFSDRYRV